MWKLLEKGKHYPIINADPESGLDLAGQRLQIVQAEGETVTLVADLVALRVNLLVPTKEGPLAPKERTVLGLIPNQTPWDYQGEANETSKWSTGENPSIAELLRGAWFVSQLGPNTDEQRIQIGRVLLANDSARFGPDIPQGIETRVSRNSIQLDPATKEFTARDTGLWVSQTNLWQPPEPNLKGRPLERPNSGIARTKPGAEKSLLTGLREADQATINARYKGFNGLLRQLAGERKKAAMALSPWIVGQSE